MTRIDLLSNPMTTAEDIIIGGASGVPERLAAGTEGDVLSIASGAVSWEAPTGGGSTFYGIPTPTQMVGQFASATTNALTVPAATSGNRLLMISCSAARGANSITQTNVTWTNRYTGNGNSLYTELWTGVTSGTGGTTATVNFTGSNNQYNIYIELPSTYPAFTTVGTTVTGTAASGTVYNLGDLATASGDYVVWIITAGQASSYTIMNHPYMPAAATGGIGRAGFLRSNGGPLALTSINVASNAWRGAMFILS